MSNDSDEQQQQPPKTERLIYCPFCNGTGSLPNTKTCATCEGEGAVELVDE